MTARVRVLAAILVCLGAAGLAAQQVFRERLTGRGRCNSFAFGSQLVRRFRGRREGAAQADVGGLRRWIGKRFAAFGDGLLLRSGDDAPDLVCHGPGT